MTQLLKDKNIIIAWLAEHNVRNATLKANEEYGYVVDVRGDVQLSHKSLEFIPVKFNVVEGSFFAVGNRLTSLEGAPIFVKKTFSVAYNKITSLKGCPDFVGGDFGMTSNDLTSLEGGPSYVGFDYSVNYNNLDSLKGIPKKINRTLDIQFNNLTSLKYCSEEIAQNFFCGDNLLTSLEYGPKIVGGVYNATSNNLTSLEFIPENAQSFSLLKNPDLGPDEQLSRYHDVFKKHKMVVEIITTKRLLENSLILNNPMSNEKNSDNTNTSDSPNSSSNTPLKGLGGPLGIVDKLSNDNHDSPAVKPTFKV